MQKKVVLICKIALLSIMLPLIISIWPPMYLKILRSFAAAKQNPRSDKRQEKKKGFKEERKPIEA